MDQRGGVDDRIVHELQRSRDFGVRVEVEDFKGYFDLDEFLDWLDDIKHFFECK